MKRFVGRLFWYSVYHGCTPTAGRICFCNICSAPARIGNRWPKPFPASRLPDGRRICRCSHRWIAAHSDARSPSQAGRTGVVARQADRRPLPPRDAKPQSSPVAPRAGFFICPEHDGRDRCLEHRNRPSRAEILASASTPRCIGV